MPKLKTRKAAAKRFKATGTGKFTRRRAFRNHLLDHKTPKQKRHLATKAVVHETDELRVVRMPRTPERPFLHDLIPPFQRHGPRQERQRRP